MKLQEIIHAVNGKLLCGKETLLEIDVDKGFASDLMSDVLTLNTDSLLLITGLANMQTIRTAEMADIRHILFVRNKMPSQEMISLAQQEEMTLILCPKSMFGACALLSNAGLKPVY